MFAKNLSTALMHGTFSGVSRLFMKIIYSVSRSLNVLSIIALVAAMLLSSANVILRLFRRPILGSFEIVGFLGTVIILFAMAQTQVEKGHTTIGIITSRFSERTQIIIDSVTYSASMVICILTAWRNSLLATNVWRAGEVSVVLKLPLSPWIYGIALSYLVFSLVLLVELFNSVAKVARK